MTDKGTSGQSVQKSPKLLEGLFLMDGIEGLRSLPRHSVDMLLTDPPYGTTPELLGCAPAAPGAVGGGEMGGQAGRRDPVLCSVPPMTRCWVHPTCPCSAMSGYGTKADAQVFSTRGGPR